MVSDRIMAPSSVFTNKQISILKSAKSLGIIRKSQFVKVKGNEHKLANGFQNSKIISTSPTPDHSKSILAQNNIPKTVHVSGTVTQKVKVMQITPPGKNPDKIPKTVGKKINKNIAPERAKTFLCKYCCRKFPNADLLDTHQKSHGSNPIHACHICGVVTSTFSSLMSHFVKHSSGKSSKKSVLEKTKVSSNNEKRSKAIPKVGNGISCTHCKRTFNKKEAFNTHYCPELNKKTEYVCTYCRKVTTTVEEYRDHIQSHSLPQFMCSSCGVQFPKRIQLSEHVNICPKKRLKFTKRNLSNATETIKSNIPNSTEPKKQKKIKLIKKKETKNQDTEESKVTCPDLKNEKLANKILPFSEEKTVNHDNSISDKAPNLLSADESDPVSLEQEKAKVIPIIKDIKKRRRRRKTVDLLDKEITPLYERRLRTVRAQSHYITDFNTGYQPTRRSARLGSRKMISFSDDGDISDHETSMEVSTEENVQSTDDIVPNEEKVNEEEITKEANSEIISNEKVDESIVIENEDDNIVQPLKKSKTMRRKGYKLNQNKSNNGTLYCQVCSLLFRSIGSLRRHKKMHTGKPQFVCQFCGKFFFRRDIHLRHENSVHQNSADKGFSCYYCKEKFESSQLLKDHSSEAHASKALVPERIRRCTGTTKNRKTVGSTKMKTETSELLENCSIDNSSNTEAKDFKIVPKVTIKTPKKRLIKTTSHNQKILDTKPVVLKSHDDCKSKIDLPNPFEIMEHTDTNVLQCSKEIPLSTILDDAKCFIKSPPQSPDVKNKSLLTCQSNPTCKLCSKELPDGQNSCCTETTHKALDWYQCLVCAYSGTKTQIQDHMLSHTYKIGTVVVNEEDENYNSTRTYLPLFTEILDVPDQYNESDDEMFVGDVWMADDDDDSPSTLMEQVKCKMCHEVIVDFEFLIHHPCAESDTDTYLCFVEGCWFHTNNKRILQSHLGKNHYTSLFASVFSKDTQKNIFHKKRCRTMPSIEPSSQIENIFIDSSEQFLTEELDLE